MMFTNACHMQISFDPDEYLPCVEHHQLSLVLSLYKQENCKSKKSGGTLRFTPRSFSQGTELPGCLPTIFFNGVY